jgi:hypothetical protein
MSMPRSVRIAPEIDAKLYEELVSVVHTFLLINGFDLDVTSKAALQFMIETMEAGKFRFALLHEWISAHLVPLVR